jgi:hypothetical protein
MLIEILIKRYKRDLNILITEVELYTDENNLWEVDNTIKNSAGNLCLHLVGNLKTFIGASIGNTDYVRERDLEFSLKNVPRIELINQVKDTIIVVENALKALPETDLQKEYKRREHEDTMTIEYFLLHLLMHLSYHLGQINYHRRFFDK